MILTRRSVASWLVLWACGLAGLLAWGCGDGSSARGQAAAVNEASLSERDDGPMRVAVTIPPLAGLVAGLLPEGSRLDVLIPPGMSPHGAELSPSAVSAIASADLFVGVGMGLDTQALSIAVARLDTDRFVVFERLVPDGAPATRASDPHLWLDPVLCEALVEAIADRVAARLRARGDEAGLAGLDRDRKALLAALGAVDRDYRTALAPFAGRGLVTHHDAWGRPASRYGLRIAGVIRTIETAEPTPAAIAGAVEAVRSAGAGVIVVEPQFSAGAAERIAELTGAALASMDPLGSGDWFTMMRTNLASLVDALGRTSGGAGRP